MIKTLLRRYLLLSGLLANVLGLFLVFYISNSLFSLYTLPVLLNKVAIYIEKHPQINSLSDPLKQLSRKLDEPAYHWKKFDRENWPTVGPDFKQLTDAELKTTEDKIFISTSKQLVEAIKNVKPGQTIIVADGDYKISGKLIEISQYKPSKDLPVRLIAENPGMVNLLLDTIEGILINQPYWGISGFKFTGVCEHHSKCEHALHVTGNAENTVIAHNEFVDFNAAIKVNRVKYHYPDSGVIKYNHFYFTSSRQTSNPVTPINIDHANDWVVSHNIIRDFSKAAGNKVSYGAFIKGGSIGGVMENNVVICNATGRINPEYITVGLSIGGGGMRSEDRRDSAPFEASQVVLRNNIIFNCSDMGVYVNKGNESLINNNTVYNTNGILLRFPESDAQLMNNIVGGKIVNVGDAKLNKANNFVVPRGFLNNEEQLSSVFTSAEIGDFTFQKDQLIQKDPAKYPQSTYVFKTTEDFCGHKIGEESHFLGAYQSDKDCFIKE
ncbi:NosD domain-containing protein [Vibrio sp. HN007]|uniref:NosD domain-containing protein n=1 Tax=Vibrio iocasae TaxID=3098914 RepID=UPI0035D3F77C